MTQREFIRYYKEYMGGNKTFIQAEKDIKGFFEAIEKVFMETEEKKIVFPSMGSFVIKQRKEKLARHPLTNEKILIPKRNKITFKCSISLEARINKGQTK